MNDLVVTAHDGVELAVRDHGGEGQDVLLLHGAQRTLEDWAPVLSHLSGVRAVAMDLRLHGRSEVPVPAWVDFVADVDSVITSVGLKNPLVVGHSFGGMIALADAVAHPERAGVVNVDGFDFRQRELFDEVEPAEVDRFLENFERQRATFIQPDAGDDAWLDQQHQMMQQTDSMWKVPGDVAAATLGRVFVRDGGGWKRRPPNAFFDILDAPDPPTRVPERARSYHPSEPSADLLHLLRETTVPTVFVLCRPPGETGMFATARSGLERHIRTIASSNANVRLETVDATHGVIFEDPARVAEVVRSLLSPPRVDPRRAVVFRWLAAGDAGDFDRFDDLLHQDAVIHAPLGLSTTSAGEEKAVWRDALAAMPDLYHDVREVVVEGDVEMARVVVTGTMNGSFAGLEGTGRSFRIDQAVIVHLRDGKVAEAWEIADVGALRSQVAEG